MIGRYYALLGFLVVGHFLWNIYAASGWQGIVTTFELMLRPEMLLLLASEFALAVLLWYYLHPTSPKYSQKGGTDRS